MPRWQIHGADERSDDTIPIVSRFAGGSSIHGARVRDCWIACVLALSGSVVLCLGLGFGLPDAVPIVGGLRLLAGEMPYRDFWSLYAPGQFYLAAGLFALFGRDVAVLSVAAALINAAAGAAFFLLLRRIGAGRGFAIAAALVLIASSWNPSVTLTSYVLPRLLLLVGWERALAYLQGEGRRTLVVAGVLFGIAAWFKHDVAAYAALGTGLGIAWVAWLRRASLPRQWQSPVAALLWLGGSAAATALPVFALTFSPWGGGGDAWQSLVIFPATEFRVVRGEVYPALLPDFVVIWSWLVEPANLAKGLRAGTAVYEWGTARLPELVFAGTLLWLVQVRKRLEAWALGVVAIALACLPLFWMAAHVQQNTHLISMALSSAMLLAIIWRDSVRVRHPEWLRAGLVMLALGYAACIAVPSGMALFNLLSRSSASLALGLPPASHLRLATEPRGGDYAVFRGIATFVREHVPPGEAIYVGLRRHDAVVIGNAGIYYLADRPIATRYHELHPGIVDRAEVQHEIIHELESKLVRCVVIWNFGWGNRVLDRILAKRREAIPELGSTQLDEYLRSHFARVARFGEYDVLWRRGAPAG